MKALILVILLLAPGVVFAECKEFRIVETANGMEAVCVGDPLTAAQIKEMEKQRRREELEQRQAVQNNEQRHVTSTGNAPPRQTNVNNSSYSSSVSMSTAASDIGNVTIESYDVKYIPSGKFRQGREAPGEYSIKITAKNNGRRGLMSFKLKQVDFNGYETESMSFSEHFESDQRKTATTHLSAHQVPFVRSQDWIIEAVKR